MTMVARYSKFESRDLQFVAMGPGYRPAGDDGGRRQQRRQTSSMPSITPPPVTMGNEPAGGDPFVKLVCSSTSGRALILSIRATPPRPHGALIPDQMVR